MTWKRWLLVVLWIVAMGIGIWRGGEQRDSWEMEMHRAALGPL